jgi:predicted GNAT superfamily acetyltransferase
MTTITYRPLDTMDEIRAAIDLEILVWRLADARDTVAAYELRAAVLFGGLVLGAWDDAQLVGMSYAMPGQRDGQTFLWSHLTCVHPDYQDRGVGRGIKLAQRDWALAQGYSQIRWTFDPLQSRNAYFNLHVLGGMARHYHPNFYGVMNDSLNPSNFPSDRLELIWPLDARPPTPDGTAAMPPFALVREGDHNQPHAHALPSDRPSVCFVAVSRHLSHWRQTKPQWVLDWQSAIRSALTTAFAAGYVAVDYQQREPWFGYLLMR